MFKIALAVAALFYFALGMVGDPPKDATDTDKLLHHVQDIEALVLACFFLIVYVGVTVMEHDGDD